MIVKQKNPFNKLSSNLLTYFYQFFSLKEVIYLSQLNRKFKKGMSNDFIWENYAKKNSLFLPGESEAFGKWKDYYMYLEKLEKNFKEGISNISFQMKPFRGHKAIITALLPVEMTNGPFCVIVSGDKDGNVFTWDLDEDGDNEKALIKKCNKGIVDIIKVNEKSILFWDEDNNFYLFQVDTLYSKGSQKKNIDRFNLEKEFKINELEATAHQVCVSKDAKEIFVSCNFHKSEDLGKAPAIFEYSLSTFSLIEKYAIPHTMTEDRELTSVPADRAGSFENKTINSNSFSIAQKYLITFKNHEFHKLTLIMNYPKRNSIPNLFVFNEKAGLKEKLRADLDYIMKIETNKAENSVCLLGYNREGNNYSVLIYSVNDSGLKFARKINLAQAQNSTTFSLELCNFGEDSIKVLVEGKTLNIIDIDKSESVRSFPIKNTQDIPLNALQCDKYRIVLGYDDNSIRVVNPNDGETWYYLIGGSLLVVPKSFISHPQYKGFHIIKLTRWSIVGVLGNLIREYSFRPNI